MPGRIIDTIVFDFGGTLDTNGIHWGHKFFDAYLQHNIIIDKNDFIKAYIFAERQAGEYIKPEDSFFNTLNIKFNLQLEYLYSKGISVNKNSCDKKELVLSCYNDVLNIVESSGKILNDLHKRFKMGIASNFYGNLETVLNEFSLRQYFSFIFDSAIEGIRKPDPRVFQITIGKLGSTCERSIVIGDSYTNDIEPGKRVGCKTIWLLKTPWEKQASDLKADYVITSLNELQTVNFS